MTTQSTVVTVTTSPTRLDVVSDNDNRTDQQLTAYNAGSVTVWVGDKDIAAGEGTPLVAGAIADWTPFLSGNAIYGIVATGTCAVNVTQVGV